MEKVILLYFFCISLLAVIYTVADKVKAKRGKWRVPEATLFFLAIIGGSAAMYITMLTIRHKTKHLRFMIGIPLIIILQAAAAAALYILF
ncbi:MAG: DUF1294 domain-containing protein [Clostridia bacterium]|nr:DUF1294 domain-containing protein [Clostridia bacterium]